MALALADLLNPPQLEAATWPSGPVCIVAGAGSGKTRVITHRLAFLVQQGLARPEECLAVTFTNKAARELRARVDALMPGMGSRMWVSTFHSAAARILREAHEVVGLPRGFVIYDQDDSERLIRQICDEMKIASDLVKVLTHRMEQLQHEGITWEAFQPEPFDIPGKRLREVARVYAQRLVTAGAVDFGGLIMHALKVVRDSPTSSYSLSRIRHAVVDEYQDVNRAQSTLVESLAPRLASLAVVGDDDQSIYRWRGASAYSLLRFTETFKTAHQVRLTENYRSNGRILKLANEVIRRNPGRLGKELWTRAGDGPPIRVRCLPSERDEAAFVVSDTEEWLRQGKRANEVAILYRTNAQSRSIEEALHRARVAYRIVGGLRFYERREVKDVVAYLRLVANPNSEMDLRRIINVPTRAIGDTTVNALAVAADTAGTSLHGALSLTDEEWVAAGIKGAGRSKLREFRNLMEEIRKACAGKPPSVAITEVIALTGYDAHLRLEEDGEDRLDNLQSLARAASDFEEDMLAAAQEATLETFLEQVSLESDAQEADDADSVTLMTLHSAKGLEYDAVYLVGMEENMLPSARALNSNETEEINEERRLCYVGLTRARHRLCITMARRRMTYGELRESPTSRFLTELPEEFLREHLTGDLHAVLPQKWARASTPIFRAEPVTRSVDRGDTRVVYDDDTPPAPRPRITSPLQLSRTRAESGVLDLDVDEEDMVQGASKSAFSRGSTVVHTQYGRGTVLSVSGTGGDARVEVQFPGAGVRRIVARFLRRG